MKLANKIALITGAGSGMGKATALLFAREGAKIAAVDIVEAHVKETAAEITKNGGQAIALRADVSKSEDVKRMVDETIAKLGVPTIVYNNAGIEGESVVRVVARRLDGRVKKQSSNRGVGVPQYTGCWRVAVELDSKVYSSSQ